MDEVWKECPFNESYEVSNQGNVRRKNGKELKLSRTPRGYLYVNLSKKSYSVHKLVAYTFLPPCPGVHGLGRGTYHIDHIDGDKSNNKASNLQWLSHEENSGQGTRRASWSKSELRRQLNQKRQELETRSVLASLTKADAILERLESMEKRVSLLLEITALEKKSEGDLWLDSKGFCRAVGIKDKSSLHYYMSKGLLTGDAIRNIGSVQRPRYRFHRVKAVNQFLNRAAK